MPSIDSVRLSNGISIPQLGLGLYKMNKSELRNVLKTFDETGCNPIHIDGVTVYENQEIFADVVEELKIPRQQLFITDKLWDTEHGNVEFACRAALKRLNTTHLDLYLIHWPFSLAPEDNDPLTAKRDAHGDPVKMDVSLPTVWNHMERLVDQGLTRCIGLSNFTRQDIESILKSARIRPVILQIESHPWLPQQELIDYCTSEDITVEAYSPLGTSLLLKNELVQRLARELLATPAQVLLAFARQRGLVALCKTGNSERLLENIKSITLNREQMSRLYSLNNGHRLFHPSSWYGTAYTDWPNM